MKKDHFSKHVVKKRIELIESVLASKAAEYSTGDAFSNFKDASKGLSFHKNPEKVAWEFMVKHLQSIKDLLDKIDSTPEQITHEIIKEKFGDAINYLILIEGMLIERADSRKEAFSELVHKLTSPAGTSIPNKD